MIRYSHTMTRLMAYHNEKRIEAISIMLQDLINIVHLLLNASPLCRDLKSKALDVVL
jgi:hypothetical protein